MVKFIQVALIVAFAAACCAQPARLAKSKQSRLARQEVAPEEEVQSQTPYPPSGIVPEIPFDLPSEGSSLEPENTYLPPDNVGGVPAQTYGPPEVTDDATDDAETTDVSVAEATDVDISAAEDEVEAEPEAQPEAEADLPEEPEDLEQPQEQDSADEEADENEIDNQQFGRLVRRRSAKLTAAKIQALPVALPQRLVAAPIQAIAPQQFIFSNGRFFAYNPQLLRV